MKKLDIPNYQSLKGLKINEWEIYGVADTIEHECGGSCYIFRLKRECGHPSHAGVAITQNIDDGCIRVTLMYHQYSNKFYTWNPKLEVLKDKMGFWKNIVFYIEKEHQKYL
jgi:hypothetical protein